MNRDNPQKYKRRILVGLVLALAGALALGSAALGQNAPQEDPPCGTEGNTCPLVGDLEPVSGDSASESWQLSAPEAPAFGALLYNPDFKLIEEQARAKLTCGLDVRQAISPYHENVAFQDYVKTFDYARGFDEEAPDLADTQCFSGETNTLGEVVDAAAQSLREARDLYAYLAVYAPEYRFRMDSYYTVDLQPGYTQTLCGATDKENPDPVHDPPDGTVLDPVIDWCNFKARLRQSVREAANLRLIFGQQFMVDAMGLHFSGIDFVGGENAVRTELDQLRKAKDQYELAEAELAESLGRSVGSGCYVSDFYTQSEWALLSRAVQNQETSQHHIATRLSYMDIASPESVPQVHQLSMQAFRQASVDGYIKLIGIASLGSAQPLGIGCNVGERPDGLLAAEMAANLLETRRKAREMDAGRNVFGFDVTFTPARAYESSVDMEDPCLATAADRGLWDEAWCAAKNAKELQDDEIANSRLFDDKQAELLEEIDNIRLNVDDAVGDKSGCYRTDFTTDDEWYACAQEQIDELESCLELVNDPVTVNMSTGVTLYDPFTRCIIEDTLKNGTAKQTLLDLRGVYLGYQNIDQKVRNIDARIQNSWSAEALVETSLWFKGILETAARTSQASVDLISCMNSALGVLDPLKATACGAAGGINIALQAAAGAASMAAEITMVEQETEKEVHNLLLDETELAIEAWAAYQQYLSKHTEFQKLMDDLEWGIVEARRARAYFQHSPANDPSFRMVRDSSRMQLARQMDYAARMAYLAARRAEYEYAARLSVNNFRISDIYRARTAQDIQSYLTGLLAVTDNLPGGPTYQTNADDFRISIAQHVLLLTDEALAKEGFTDPAAAQAERTRRFRLWVAENTINDPEISSKPVLRFNFSTSLLDGGLFANVIQEGYDRYWLLKLSGIGQPKTSSNGVSLNLVTDQSGLSYRTTALTQGGLVHLRSIHGCTFDYRLLAPAYLLGLEWAESQNPEDATAVWKANVNDGHAYTESGYRTPTFFSRAVSTTDWEALVYSGAPAAGMPDMNLQLLTDLELIFSTTYASRQPGEPNPSACTRIDW